MNEIIILFLLFCFLITYIIYLQYRKKITLYQSYKDIEPILSNAKNTAYTSIYNTYVATEIINHTKLSSSQLNDLSRKYIKLLFNILGPKFISDLCIIYSKKENLVTLLINEFIITVVGDEISKHGNMLNEEEEEEKLVA